jgi:predicted TIM-barrel fold metal-dependent hydrolase
MRVVAGEVSDMKTISGTWNDSFEAVTLIDAHHHLWDLKQNYYPWLSDHIEENFFLGPYDALKRQYMPEDYLADAAGHNVLATIHCEAEWDRADQVGETRWLTKINELYGFPNAIVAHAWLNTPNTAEVIAKQASFSLVRGIRSKPVTSLSPKEMKPGAPGTMQDDKWLQGFALLGKHNLSWDLRVPFWHLPEAAEIARSFPQTPIVLNHTGFPWDRSEEGLTAWRHAMETIARESNVHLKVSEFGLRNAPWEYESNRRVVLDAIAIFGIERCIFATNFPVASLRVDFDVLVRSVKRMLSDFSDEEQDGFFWKNAARFYCLDIR